MQGNKVLRFTENAPPNAGKGRKKGVPNKINSQIKDMILGALEKAGGQEYLTRCAEQEPRAFLALLGRLLPHQIGGDPENPIIGRKVEELSDDELMALIAAGRPKA